MAFGPSLDGGLADLPVLLTLPLMATCGVILRARRSPTNAVT